MIENAYSIVALEIRGINTSTTLSSPIEFKHMIALTNETQIMLSFP